jgi:hypothetical protein
MATYGVALERWATELSRRDFDEVIERSGAERAGPDRILLRFLAQDYEIGHPDGQVWTASGRPVEETLAILLLLYLTEADGRPLQHRWVAFEQLPGGAGYSSAFRRPVLGSLLQTFGQRPEALLEAAVGLDGSSLDMGDAAVVLAALPRVPVAIVLWGGDEEFAPSASVAFDASIEGYLDTEAVTALAHFTSRRLIEAAEGGSEAEASR